MGSAEDGIEGLRSQPKFRDIGFADDNSAGLLLTLHHSAIEVGDIVFVKGGAEGGANSSGFVQVFSANRETVKRTEPFAFGESFVGGSSLGHQLVFRDHGDHRVNFGIDAIDLLQVSLHDLAG